MYCAQMPGPRVRRRYCQRSALPSLLCTLRIFLRVYRSSATCSTGARGLPSSCYPPLVSIRELSHTEVRSITILPLVHNTAERAYILGGRQCQDARRTCTKTPSVEVLDMSQGDWQAFPVLLNRAAEYFQFATLDSEVGAFVRTNDTVNDRFSEDCRYLITTTAAPSTASPRGRWQAYIALAFTLLLVRSFRFGSPISNNLTCAALKMR